SHRWRSGGDDAADDERAHRDDPAQAASHELDGAARTTPESRQEPAHRSTSIEPAPASTCNLPVPGPPPTVRATRWTALWCVRATASGDYLLRRICPIWLVLMLPPWFVEATKAKLLGCVTWTWTTHTFLPPRVAASGVASSAGPEPSAGQYENDGSTPGGASMIVRQIPGCGVSV